MDAVFSTIHFPNENLSRIYLHGSARREMVAYVTSKELAERIVSALNKEDRVDAKQ